MKHLLFSEVACALSLHHLSRRKFLTMLAGAGAGSAFAHHEFGRQPSGQVQAPAAVQKTGKGTGLIQQIDREKGAVTIRLHGINAPGMTLSFMVNDKAMLANLRPSQKVDFEFTYDGKQYLITSIK